MSDKSECSYDSAYDYDYSDDEDLENKIKDIESFKKFKRYVQVYCTLKKINEKNYKKIIKSSFVDEYISTTEGIYLLVRIIYPKIGSICCFFKDFYDELKKLERDDNKISEFPNILLDYLLRDSSDCLFSRNVHDFNIINRIWYSNCIDRAIISCKVEKFVIKHRRNIKLMIVAHLYLGEFLRYYNEQLADHIRMVVEMNKDKEIERNKPLYDFPEKYTREMNLLNAYELLKDYPDIFQEYMLYGVPKSNILYSIRNDDVQDFIHKLSDYKEGVDTIVRFNPLDPVQTLAQDPSLIQYAAFYGAVGVFRYLLSRGANLDYKDKWNRTVDDFAVLGSSIEIINALCIRGRNLQNSLKCAAKIRDKKVFRYISNTSGSTPENMVETLNVCCSSNKPDMVLHALKRGAGINDYDEGGYTALISAVVGRCMPIIEFILSFKDSDINITSCENSESALHVAARNGYINIVQYLLDSGIDINLVDKNGRTAFLISVFNNNPEVMEILLAQPNIDVTIHPEVRDPVRIAVEYELEEAVEVLLKYPHLFDFNKPFSGYRTVPLVYLAGKGNLRMIEKMLEYDHIDPNAEECYYRATFVMAAVEFGKTEIFDYCLENRDVNIVKCDKFSRTILNFARKPSPPILDHVVRRLLERIDDFAEIIKIESCKETLRMVERILASNNMCEQPRFQKLFDALASHQ